MGKCGITEKYNRPLQDKKILILISTTLANCEDFPKGKSDAMAVIRCCATFFMKEPKEKAQELIVDFIHMMPDGIDKIGYQYKTQYEIAKCQAEYTAMTVKHSCKDGSKKHKYWLEVQNQIKLL